MLAVPGGSGSPQDCRGIWERNIKAGRFNADGGIGVMSVRKRRCRTEMWEPAMDVFWFWFVVLLLVVFIFAWPAWPYTRGRGIYERGGAWPYVPSGTALTLALIILLLVWLGLIVAAVP